MKVKYGAIHGRFQPFHKGHLTLIKKALTKCKILFIGLSPDPNGNIKEKSPDRHLYLSAKNPFSFFERMLMIKNSLIEEGIDLKKVNIVLFPSYYSNPNEWKKYVPPSTTHFVLITSNWDKEKIKYMKKIGMKVKILGKIKQTISATEVRKRMVNGERWEDLVPKAVVKIVKEFNGIKRVKELAKKYPEFYT